MMTLTLAELAKITGGELHGDETVCVSRVAPMDKAGEGDVTFLSNPKYAVHLAECKATVVMLKADQRKHCSGHVSCGRRPLCCFC